MTQTILGHLTGRLSGNFEDAATEGLSFLLRRNEAARTRLIKLLSGNGTSLPENLSFRTRMRDPQHGCPDLLGSDPGSHERRVLIEVKFGAALTWRQKTAYRELLDSDKPSVLAFLVPGVRLASVHGELEFPGSPHPSQSIYRSPPEDDDPVSRVLLSWEHLLEELKDDEVTGEDYACNLAQLEELVEAGGIMTFVPFEPSHLEPEHGRAFRQLVGIVDQLTGDASSAHGGRLGSYIKELPWKIHDYRCDLMLSPRLWYQQEYESPLWMAIRTKSRSGSPSGRKIHDALGGEFDVILYHDEPTVCLEVQTNVSREEVLTSLNDELESIRAMAEKAGSDPA